MPTIRKRSCSQKKRGYVHITLEELCSHNPRIGVSISDGGVAKTFSDHIRGPPSVPTPPFWSLGEERGLQEKRLRTE